MRSNGHATDQSSLDRRKGFLKSLFCSGREVHAHQREWENLKREGESHSPSKRSERDDRRDSCPAKLQEKGSIKRSWDEDVTEEGGKLRDCSSRSHETRETKGVEG